LAALIEQCLAPKPADRPSSAGEIERCLAHAGRPVRQAAPRVAREGNATSLTLVVLALLLAAGSVHSVIAQLDALFERRFEHDD